MHNGQPTRPVEVRASDRLGASLRFRLPWNYLLRRVLAVVRRIVCLIQCEGEDSSVTVTVSTAPTILRAPDAMAKRTEVINLGAVNVSIHEDGLLIGVATPGSLLVLPMAGSLLIEGRAESGTAQVQITTRRRCLCGDEESDTYEEVDPIGEELI